MITEYLTKLAVKLLPVVSETEHRHTRTAMKDRGLMLDRKEEELHRTYSELFAAREEAAEANKSKFRAEERMSRYLSDPHAWARDHSRLLSQMDAAEMRAVPYPKVGAEVREIEDTMLRTRRFEIEFRPVKINVVVADTSRTSFRSPEGVMEMVYAHVFHRDVVPQIQQELTHQIKKALGK